MDIKLEKLSAQMLGSLVNKRYIKPVEVIEYFAEHITKNNDKTNSFVYLKIEEAIEQAIQLEKKLEDKYYYAGPFAGVPFGLKDFLPSKKGWTNTHGGVESLTAVDAYDSEFCKAMERAGGIAIGKTNAPAYGFRGTTDNKMYGPTKNPFNEKYNSGGSSGGSAAAVAAELVPIAEGGDAGGSIRIPASWCGCYGFKASFGSIPNICRPDAWSASHPYCTPGGLTKTVADAAILLSYMSRYDSRDPLSAPFERPNYITALEDNSCKPRIAFTYDFDLFEVETEIKSKVFETASLLGPVDIVHFNFNYELKELSDAWCRGICVDSAIEDIIGTVRPDSKDLPKEFIYWNNRVKKLGIMDYYKFHTIRTDVYDNIENVFDKYDIIISPTSCCLPVRNTKNTVGPNKINGKSCDALIGFAQTFLFNLTGHPAASVPAGFSKTGLPIGMQIVGRRYHDEDVLKVSSMIEKLQPWRQYYTKEV